MSRPIEVSGRGDIIIMVPSYAAGVNGRGRGKKKKKRQASSEAGIEVAAGEASPAPGISIIIISSISLGAILLPSHRDQTQTPIKNGCFNSK